MHLSNVEMPNLPAVDDTMRDVAVTRCKDDKWSAETRKCMVAAKTMTDSRACYRKLTQDHAQVACARRSIS